MLKESLQWHTENKIDDILTAYQMLDNGICKYFPGGWHHYDKDGRPLYILRLGCMDVKGVLKSIGEDGLLKLVGIHENQKNKHTKHNICRSCFGFYSVVFLFVLLFV